MRTKRIFIFLGSLWDLARFFIVLSVIVALFDAAGGRSAVIMPWLLLAASAALLVPVGGILLSIYPSRYANLVGLLRLGKVLNLFSLFLLLVSGFLADYAEAPSLRLGAFSVTQAVLLLAVMLFDLIFLAFLISYKAEADVP
jgi:hypothetical protein